MQYERARAIMASPATIEVLYNGLPVWIEQLNQDHQTALITADDLPESGKDVPVRELLEK